MQSWIIAHKWLFRYGAVFIAGIVVLSAIGSYWTSFWHALRLVVAGMFIFILPGWCTSIFFFPDHDRITDNIAQSEKRSSLDCIERAILTIILSIIISSAVIFVLNIIPGEKLNPKNFAIAIILLNVVLFAGAAWKMRWLSPIYSLVLIAFTFIVVVLSRVFNVALSVRNFTIEVLLLVFVLIFIRVVTKRRSPAS